MSLSPPRWRRAIILLIAGAMPFLPITSKELTAQELNVSDFAAWRERSFNGNTIYHADVDSETGSSVLHAYADGQASAFYRTGRIDLSATPCLHWRWRIDETAPATIEEQTRAGDDYAARVYVVRRGGLAFWRAKTINYVWSATQPAGTRWPNAYAGDNAQMWALDSGNKNAGVWIAHSRDIQADWQQSFNEQISHLDGIAIMTDGDDSGSQLRAAYATLRFTARPDSGRCGDAG
jgi:hypothetical protein